MKKNIEPVKMIMRRFGYFPLRFEWRERMYNVQSINRCWTTGTKNKTRYYFDAQCNEGAFVLYQSLADSTWHVEVKP